MVSVATAKVEGRRRSWTGAEGCSLDPFDATDEPSGCSPSQAAIRRTMIVFNHQFGKFSHSCCRLTDVRHAPSEPPAERTLADGDWRECVRSAAAARCAWLSWTAFPTKNSSLSIISYEKHRRCSRRKSSINMAQWVVRLVVVVKGSGVDEWPCIKLVWVLFVCLFYYGNPTGRGLITGNPSKP